MGAVVYMARYCVMVLGGCIHNEGYLKGAAGQPPFKYPKLWIQPPKTNTVQGHINYSPHWWVFVQEFPIKSDFRAKNTRAAQRFKGPKHEGSDSRAQNHNLSC